MLNSDGIRNPVLISKQYCIRNSVSAGRHNRSIKLSRRRYQEVGGVAKTSNEEFPAALEITALIPMCLEVAEPGLAARVLHTDGERDVTVYVRVGKSVKSVDRPVVLVDGVGKRTSGWKGRDEEPFSFEYCGACVSVAPYLPVSLPTNNHCNSLFKPRQ